MSIKTSRTAQTSRASNPQLPANLRAQMERLHDFGHSLIPLGGDGKRALVKFKDKQRLPFDAVVQAMEQAGSFTYGIRLPNLLVVDVDTRTPETQDYVAKRFDASPVTVKTPRGRHHYYRLGNAPVPKAVRQPGVEIDFKRGPNSYVLGPYSTRPDGGIYVPENDDLGIITDLPVFRDLQPEVAPPVRYEMRKGRVAIGGRNRFMVQTAVEYASAYDTYDEILAELMATRDQQLEDWENYSDAQVIGTAKWVWTLRLENRLWGGGPARVVKTRDVHDLLAPHPKGGDALMLLGYLEMNHAPRVLRGETFAIDRRAMVRDGTIPGWTEYRIRQAKNVLLDFQLIRCVSRGVWKGRKITANRYTLKLRGPSKDHGLPTIKPRTGGKDD